MRRAKWLAVLVAIPFILFAGAGLLIKTMLSGSAKDSLLESVHKSTGVAAQFTSADFDLSSWFRLQPSIALREVTVANPPGFQAPSLLTASSIQAHVGLMSLFTPEPQVHSLVVEQPKIVVEKNSAGVSNIEALFLGLSKPSASTEGGVTISSLSITGGELQLPSGGVSLTGIDIQLTGLSPGKACDITLKASPFGGKTSLIEFKGSLGPFTPTALPVDGDAKIVISPAEAPGGLVSAPKTALLKLTAGLKGDLNDSLSGPAHLNFSGFHMGLTGEAQAAFSVARIMSAPQTSVHVSNGMMQLGKGSWKGSLDLRAGSGLIRGSSKGSIENVDINEFLTNFTSSKDAMKGTLAINNYDIRFAGKDANEIQRSLNGTAALDIQRGSIKVLDLLGGIQTAINKVMGASGGETTFSTLTSGLSLAGGALEFSNIKLQSPVTGATGQGRINADQTLDFTLDVVSTGNTPIPVAIKGTTAAPKVMPNIGKAAVTTGLTFLEKFLKKKEAK